MLVGYKLYYKTELIPLTEVDLVSGRREFDEDEAAEDEKMAHDPRPWWKKAWESA
jgi:yeast amino acid transporter